MSLKDDSARKFRKEKNKWDIESYSDYEEREENLLKQRLYSKEPTITGEVRITGGKVKNYNISIPKNTRPLTDRIKVRIFDILSKDIANKRILDLYAGSGSFGLESLSRGAKHVTFVDASKHSYRAIDENIKKLGLSEQTELIKEKTDEYLFKLKDSDLIFDIVFMDPPFKLYNTKNLFKMQNTINLASQFLPGVKTTKNKFKGALIIKHPRHYPIEKIVLQNLKIAEKYKFGLNTLTLMIVKH